LHGLGEFFQAEGPDRVVEQAALGAWRTRWHAATVTGAGAS
jgi:hypothetical protein